MQDTAAPTQSGQDPRGTNYEYDSKGNLQRIERVPDDSVSIAFNYKDAIDAVDGKTGQLEEVIDPRGHSTTLDYWPDGTLKQITPPTDGRAGATLTPTSFQYDTGTGDQAMGRITRRIDDDTDHKLEYGYDGLDRVQTMRKLDSTNAERFKWVFTYDFDGNVTKREDFVNGRR